METIRIHGRGGQGVVTAAELIAIAAFYDGKYSQAFPSFGVERSGAPIQSFARIDDQPIILSPIFEEIPIGFSPFITEIHHHVGQAETE